MSYCTNDFGVKFCCCVEVISIKIISPDLVKKGVMKRHVILHLCCCGNTVIYITVKTLIYSAVTTISFMLLWKHCHLYHSENSHLYCCEGAVIYISENTVIYVAVKALSFILL